MFLPVKPKAQVDVYIQTALYTHQFTRKFIQMHVRINLLRFQSFTTPNRISKIFKDARHENRVLNDSNIRIVRAPHKLQRR